MMKSVLVLLVLTAVASSYRLNGFKDLLSRKKLMHEVKDEVLRELHMQKRDVPECDKGEKKADEDYDECIKQAKRWKTYEGSCMINYRNALEDLMDTYGCDDLVQALYGEQKKRK